MENNEIRLRILCEFYNALFQKEDQHPSGISKKLGISTEEENAGHLWLIDKNLLDGVVEYAGSYVLASPHRITAYGMDRVEAIMDKTFIEIKEKTEEFDKGTKKEKITKFMKKCLSNDATIPACKTALEIASSILGSP